MDKILEEFGSVVQTLILNQFIIAIFMIILLKVTVN